MDWLVERISVFFFFAVFFKFWQWAATYVALTLILLSQCASSPPLGGCTVYFEIYVDVCSACDVIINQRKWRSHDPVNPVQGLEHLFLKKKICTSDIYIEEKN